MQIQEGYDHADEDGYEYKQWGRINGFEAVPSPPNTAGYRVKANPAGALSIGILQ